ncbi:hypothetical protein A3A74_02440 [Candidatus Roizmanbacteria bacterium RIFCSPLOWO2_01_FULL_35_13]|uniref:Glycosyltransferase RgtA/B/C/D-like domain-containing protein n=1 Tax=Candidatus Roizmanbacteria bacterium RIFCSPLOWO2_01_FULL_35_13 TaxID=1802055 RepID=A0A1F7IEQ4_9BACT|nr:MAG: hypothetical protein A3A74_02440 [Candidatus Roizmanbacteria bacterium RIFCSPLOWO2_01_FULL_35_13]
MVECRSNSRDKKNYLTAIFLIIVISFILRVFDLVNNPPGFFADEAAIGYNAYKILKTGGDEYGVPFPIFFRSLGDYRLPIPIYANIPMIALFGLNEFSVRLTVVLFGLISILFTILLTTEIWGKNTGLLAGLLLSISPWHIHMSRWGSEYIYFPALFSIALFFYVKSFHKKSNLITSCFFFGLGMYTYYSTLIVTPILLFFCLIFWLIKKKLAGWKYAVLGLSVFILLCLPIYFGYKSGVLLTRWESISKNVSLSLKEKIRQTSNHYLDHFSLDFLFLKGDIDFKDQFVSRHSVRGFGELYLYQLPLLILGLYLCYIKRRDLRIVPILILLLLYPVGSAITNDGPQATRAIIGVIPFSIISAVGLNKILEFRHGIKKSFLRTGIFIFITVMISLSLVKYGFSFYVKYPLYSADFWGWQYGPKEIVNYFLKERNNYDELYMTGNFNAPYIFLKFYDPEGRCKNCFLGGINNYSEDKKQLFALAVAELEEAKKRYPQPKLTIFKTIYYPDHKPAFYIGTFTWY